MEFYFFCFEFSFDGVVGVVVEVARIRLQAFDLGAQAVARERVVGKAREGRWLAAEGERRGGVVAVDERFLGVLEININIEVQTNMKDNKRLFQRYDPAFPYERKAAGAGPVSYSPACADPAEYHRMPGVSTKRREK